MRRLDPITFSETHCNLSFESVHDGWGISPEKGTKGDAIDAADTTNMDTIAKNHAYRTLLAHGNAVGLSDGLMGNSEVGYVGLAHTCLSLFSDTAAIQSRIDTSTSVLAGSSGRTSSGSMCRSPRDSFTRTRRSSRARSALKRVTDVCTYLVW